MPITPVEQILTSVGLPADEVAKIITAKEGDEFDPKPIVEKVRANYQTQFKNDPSFFEGVTMENLPVEVKKTLESAQFARASGIMKTKMLKGLGLTEADLADLTEEQRDKLEPFVHAITEKYAKKNTNDKQLQQELIEARKKAEQYGPDYEKEVEKKYETKAEQRITAAIFNASLIGELSTIPGLKIAASDIAKTANDILQSKYAFERTGDLVVELRQKNNPQMKVLKEGSSKEVTLKDALLEIATERGWIEAEKKPTTTSGTVPVVPGKEGLKMVVAPHVQEKLAKKIASEG